MPTALRLPLPALTLAGAYPGVVAQTPIKPHRVAEHAEGPSYC